MRQPRREPIGFGVAWDAAWLAIHVPFEHRRSRRAGGSARGRCGELRRGLARTGALMSCIRGRTRRTVSRRREKGHRAQGVGARARGGGGLLGERCGCGNCGTRRREEVASAHVGRRASRMQLLYIVCVLYVRRLHLQCSLFKEIQQQIRVAVRVGVYSTVPYDLLSF